MSPLSRKKISALEMMQSLESSQNTLFNLFNSSRLCTDNGTNINLQLILLISSKITASPCLEYNMLLFNISSINALSFSVNSQLQIIYIKSCYSKTYNVKKPNLCMLKHVKCYESTLYGFGYFSFCDVYNIITISVINAKDSHYIVGIYSVKNESLFLLVITCLTNIEFH
ncbi:hypothetical protein H5410_003579 [Solanum commersonii]|uniref:Uncharacterized protein n=1 Tax=Solanum commersonii TaxID=4109 RepID=A0A9J6B537_SOLCO|nr:hypothetical protein H5410_003579 [Solanum commersonii]